MMVMRKCIDMIEALPEAARMRITNWLAAQVYDHRQDGLLSPLAQGVSAKNFGTVS